MAISKRQNKVVSLYLAWPVHNLSKLCLMSEVMTWAEWLGQTMVGGGDRRNSLGHCILLEIFSATFNFAFIDLCLALSGSSLLLPSFWHDWSYIYVIVDEDTILCTNSQQQLIPHPTTDKGFITTLETTQPLIDNISFLWIGGQLLICEHLWTTRTVGNYTFLGICTSLFWQSAS